MNGNFKKHIQFLNIWTKLKKKLLERTIKAFFFTSNSEENPQYFISNNLFVIKIITY